MEDKLDTVLAADRIKKLQGKEVTEKPLDYWSDKKKEDEDIEEKEALIQKYVTTPKPAPVPQTKDSGLSKRKIIPVNICCCGIFRWHGIWCLCDKHACK